jgi:NAD(P)-dependent dehydrogenase (short-subunit alcohol dehydrogenase family)
VTAQPTATRVAVMAGHSGAVASAIRERLEAEGFKVATIDASDRDQAKAAADRIARELGPISVLVTAPEHHDGAPFGELSAQRWQRLLMAHLGATVNACAAVGPAMVQAKRGTIITLSSWLALAGVPGEAYFAAATGSILAFTKSFAIEVARHGVRVNCIAVGPLDRGVRPVDIAQTVAFLINDGDFFVGQVLSPAAGAVV